jgi:Winged helix DNA-binding domain
MLTLRALNRATLARQHLLRRVSLPALDAVEHLVGLQAQVPFDPYTALWSRLEGFRAEELARLLEERGVVRIALMRSTVHLVSADDSLLIRPLMQPVLDAELARYRDLRGVDVEAVLAYARELVAERPLSGRELRAALGKRFPQHDAADLAYACRNLLAFVQVPPRGVWGQTSQVRSTTVESWLGRSLVAEPSLEEVVLRYFGAFGPAAVADVTAWSRLTGLRDVVERLRPRLLAFRDDRGRELLDLRDAPRPDPSAPAPPRFLPEYDNVLLSHADRSRFLSDDNRKRLGRAGGIGWGSFLVDGRVRGLWTVRRNGDEAALVARALDGMSKRSSAALTAEGQRLLSFLAPDATTREVQLTEIA